MKIFPFKIPKPNDDALIYQEDHEYVFYDKLHEHEEIQLSYIAKGSGTLIVGDSINTYNKGDIVVIGSNLPHMFRSELAEEKSFMISLFFTKDSFGEDFFDLEELKLVTPFFKRSLNGFIITSHELHKVFLALEAQNKFERFVSLLTLLRRLSKLNFERLSSFIYAKQYSVNEGQRMSAIMDFTTTNYMNFISLNDVASVANMTVNSFCKYFKKRTNKSYFSFLNELRIAHACKLLRSKNELSVVEIAELSGFNNLSNFNRQFKRQKLITPVIYRKSID